MVAAEEANGNAGAVVAVGAPRAALLDSGTEVPETQTRKIGLIYPPPDIRAIADKTALYVAKNGARRGSDAFDARCCLFRGMALSSDWAWDRPRSPCTPPPGRPRL